MSQNTIAVSGNTFRHKDAIRRAGGRWDRARQEWDIPANAKAQLEHLPGLRFSGTAGKDIRIEYPSRGATYCRDEYGVYEYSEYGPGSVLEGQECRRFLASYPSLVEAQTAYPDADVTGCGFSPPYLDHLPDDTDY